MSDPQDDILAKADQLLRRHAPPQPDAEPGAEVPVLTDLVEPGVGAPARAAVSEAASDAALEPDEALVAEVVQAVQARLAGDLERRLTRHLEAEVQAAVAAALGDLRQDFANAVGDAVAAALARRPRR